MGFLRGKGNAAIHPELRALFHRLFERVFSKAAQSEHHLWTGGYDLVAFQNTQAGGILANRLNTATRSKTPAVCNMDRGTRADTQHARRVI